MKKIDEFKDQYRFLSNFYPSPFYFNKEMYKTNEHFFQAKKMATEEEAQLIIACDHPQEAKSMARTLTMEPKWSIHKDFVMLLGLRLKFLSNPFLTKMLLDTRNIELIEGNTWNDTYWGVCNGVGLNKLGKALMIVREELKQENYII